MIKIKEVNMEEAFRNKDKDAIIALERANDIATGDCNTISLDELMDSLGVTRADLDELENKHRDKAMTYNMALNQIGGMIEDQEEDGLTDSELISIIKRYVDWALMDKPLTDEL